MNFFKKFVSRQLLLILLMGIITSCTSMGPHYNCTYKGKKFKTYSIYRPFVGLSDYKGGYWGEWISDNSLRYEVKNLYPGFEIVYYDKYSHPSDFEYKIIVKDRKANNGNWEVYDGEIQIKKANETHMRPSYTKDITGINALKDVWTFPATIRRTYSKLPEEKFIYPQIPTELLYVYNVYYNGVGRAFDINGTWVGADQFDPWK